MKLWKRYDLRRIIFIYLLYGWSKMMDFWGSYYQDHIFHAIVHIIFQKDAGWKLSGWFKLDLSKCLPRYSSALPTGWVNTLHLFFILRIFIRLLYACIWALLSVIKLNFIVHQARYFFKLSAWRSIYFKYLKY